jgi:hypothetical protein
VNREFNLSIRPEINNICNDILDDEELLELDLLIEFLLSGNTWEPAIKILQDKIGTRPKRPISYLKYEVGYLPENTRNIGRYAGDYIDHLMKHLAHEKGRNKAIAALSSSLGANIKRSEECLGKSLHDILKRYEKYIYTPAKHEMNVGSRPHLFSAGEAITICLITMKLGRALINLSEEAKAYSENLIYE